MLWLVATVGTSAAFFLSSCDGRGAREWTVAVTNERAADVVVGGIAGPMSESTGYTIVGLHTSEVAHIGNGATPPDSVVFDFESHRGASGELIVVPSWQATHKPVVCSWDDVQSQQPIVITDATTSCAELTHK